MRPLKLNNPIDKQFFTPKIRGFRFHFTAHYGEKATDCHVNALNMREAIAAIEYAIGEKLERTSLVTMEQL